MEQQILTKTWKLVPPLPTGVPIVLYYFKSSLPVCIKVELEHTMAPPSSVCAAEISVVL